VAGPQPVLSPVSLQFVGSGDAFGSGGRFQTCMALRAGDDLTLIDCGASSLVALKRAGIAPGDVAAVVVSHLHGDHFAGVPFLVLDGQFSRRERPLVVAGPPGLAARMEAAMEVLFPGSSRTARRFPVEFIELPDRVETAVGQTRVTAFTVVHASGAPAYALRVACRGRVVAYSGDTEWTDALLEVARDADLFVCEALSFERSLRFHLSWAAVRAARDRLRCRRLVLTHLGREMLDRRGDVDAECADDGLTISLD
jgi:ribonuclease BN (tRNA processing enzyme)